MLTAKCHFLLELPQFMLYMRDYLCGVSMGVLKQKITITILYSIHTVIVYLASYHMK